MVQSSGGRARALLLRVCLAAALAAGAVSGCDKGAQLLEQLPPVPGAAPTTAVAAPRIELQLDRPFVMVLCYARLVRLEGRTPVLQAGTSDGYPRFFLRAQGAQSDLAALAGSKLPAEIYFQEKENGPVFYTNEELPGEITISTAQANCLVGQFSAQFESGSGAIQSATGTITAPLEVVPR